MTLAANPRLFLLHHTHEDRVGLCASDDPNPPGEQQVIAALSFEQTIGLLDDIDETLADCVRRDGWQEED